MNLRTVAILPMSFSAILTNGQRRRCLILLWESVRLSIRGRLHFTFSLEPILLSPLFLILKWQRFVIAERYSGSLVAGQCQRSTMPKSSAPNSLRYFPDCLSAVPISSRLSKVHAPGRTLCRQEASNPRWIISGSGLSRVQRVSG